MDYGFEVEKESDHTIILDERVKYRHEDLLTSFLRLKRRRSGPALGEIIILRTEATHKYKFGGIGRPFPTYWQVISPRKAAALYEGPRDPELFVQCSSVSFKTADIVARDVQHSFKGGYIHISLDEQKRQEKFLALQNEHKDKSRLSTGEGPGAKRQKIMETNDE